MGHLTAGPFEDPKFQLKDNRSLEDLKGGNNKIPSEFLKKDILNSNVEIRLGYERN